MDRATILGKLSAGDLSADEAARLLREPDPPAAGLAVDASRRLRVRVSSLQTGRERVNVNLPVVLLQAGLKLGARYEPRIADLDLGEILEAARSGADGKLVDVENWDSGERVEVFID